MFCLIPQCIPLHSPPFHTCTYRSLQFLAGWCPYLWAVPEVPDGVASFEIHFNPMFSANDFAAFTHSLHTRDHYVGLVVMSVVLVLTCPLFGSILVLLDVNSV